MAAQNDHTNELSFNGAMLNGISLFSRRVAVSSVITDEVDV